MRIKTSKGARTAGIVCFIFAAVCMGVSIANLVYRGQGWETNFGLLLFCSIIWIVCGIIILLTSKKLKDEESKKVKINAFNYAKVRKKK